jgi:hypothetical protein
MIVIAGAARGQTPAEQDFGSTGDPSAYLFTQGQPPDATKPQTPPLPPPPLTLPSPTNTLTDPANRPPRLSLSSRANWKAPMLGDIFGYYATGTLTSVTQVAVFNPNGGRQIATITDTVRVGSPLLTRTGFKIAENESPIPEDRVFATYNYFYRLQVPVLSQTTTAVPAFNRPGAPTTQFPSSLNDILVSPMEAHVVTAGVEKTFLDGDASVGIRVPFYFSSQSFSSVPNQAALNARFGGFGPVTGNVVGLSDGVGGSAVGDLTAIFKYALVRNNETGNLLSTGLAVTVPTGRISGPPDATAPNDVLLQPFVGYVLNADRLYLHAFHSVIVPTNSADVTLLANDFGLGYRWLERDDGAAAIIPTVECHVTTPLNHRDPTGPFYFPNLVVFTAGTHFVCHGTVLTLGAATPVTGPRPYQVEAQARLNWFY